jgi:hypothetical protein
LSGSTLVYTTSTTTAIIVTAATTTKTATSITLSGADANIAVGDRLTFAGSTNDGVGYRVVSVAGAVLTIAPGLQNAITGPAAVTRVASNIAVGDAAVLESGQIIQVALPTGEQIAIGSTNGYVLLADTTQIKDNSLQGTTATTAVRMLGSKAVAGASNSFTWSYTRTPNGSTSGNIDLSDSYIVAGKSLLYQ